MRQSGRPYRRRFWRLPIFWLSVLYLLVGIAYTLVTPMLEKPDEEGHYGYVRFLRERRQLPPLHSSDPWLAESKQPPAYYVLAAISTGWLPDAVDDSRPLVLNRYMDFSVPGYRNDNRNQFLHPPQMTPVVLGSRLLSLVFGLGTMLVSYWLAQRLGQHSSARGTTQPSRLFPENPLVAIAVAAVVGFHPKFLYIATAVNNDAAIVFLSTLVVALLVYRLQRGGPRYFPVLLGGLLGLASITKVSGLVLIPLTGLALLLIHRGARPAFFRDGIIILAVVLLIGGWWYARNGLLYSDPFTIGAHTSEDAEFRPLGDRLGHDLAGVEHTYWANPARTFVSEIRLDRVSIWWGRISLGLFVVGFLLHRADVRSSLSTFSVLLSWPLTYFFLLVVFWNQRFRWPFGRLLFPSLVPLSLLLVWGWQRAFPRRWWRPLTALGAGTLMVVSILTPFVSVYPLYRPWREPQAEGMEHPVDIVYSDIQTGQQIARLVGYNLPDPAALSGTFFPIELCWESLGQTDVPYAVFVQLLDLSQMDTDDSPGIWGRRETYPGLGNLPTDRWPLGKTFCDTLMTWIYPETPTPLGAAVEVGFFDPDTANRLQPMEPQGQPIPLAVVGGVSILSPETSLSDPADAGQALYILDDAIALHRADISGDNSITVTLTWRSLRSVSYDATTFFHLRGRDGSILTQADRQPLDGRYPTSYWLPGQNITDVVSLAPAPDAYDGHAFGGPGEAGSLTLQIGMYTWPSLERLSVVDASGMPQPDHVMVFDVPSTFEPVITP